MPRENLNSLFREFERYGSDIAFVQRRGYRREAWTYRKLARVAFTCASELKKGGIRTGDRVLLWGPNNAEWTAAFWGCLLRGAVAVPMDDGATLDFASRVARDAGVKLILSSREKAPLDPAILRLVLEDLADTAGQMDQTFPESLPDEPITRNHIAQILFTSGTTAEPRGVVLTHGNFLANIEPLERGIDPYRKYERWFHPLRFVTLVPLSHVFGQFMALFVPPLLGATVVFEQSANPSEIIRTVKRERATALIAVPRMLDALHARIEREFGARGQGGWLKKTFDAANEQKFLRRAWRFRRIHRRFGWKFWAFISGGAALSADTEEFFKRVGYAVVQGYGMTETASLISLNHPFRATQGSIGKILPGREFRLAEDGEILVRGENVASAYWQGGAMREATRENDGWLRTGDLGELDAQGNLRFRGRKKNVIVTPAGLNIHPEDLEAALRKQPAVRDAVVVPIGFDANADPCAILLLRSPGTAPALIAQSAIDQANDSLSEFQRIRRWLMWPEPDFPRTPTGKPRLAELSSRATELLRDNAGGPMDAQSKPLVIPSQASDLLSPSLSLPRSLRDLSSLDRVELLSTLEHRYNIEINETQFANAETAADLQKLIAEPAARRSDYVYPGWTQRLPIRLLRLLVYYALTWPATLLLGHPTVRGRENLANTNDPLLFVANHTTRRADIGLILYALPARFRHRLASAMAGETLQTFRQPPQNWFFAKRWLWKFNYFLVVSLFNVFPLPQLSGFRESFRFAGESADRGNSLLVFPEGVVNDRATPEMVPFQQGIGLLAQNLQIPIVPMRLDGVWQMKQEHRRLAHLGELTIHIGAPVTFPADTAPAEIASRLQELVHSA